MRLRSASRSLDDPPTQSRQGPRRRAWPLESFWASLKIEFYYRHTWPTEQHARREVIRWITQIDDARRRHSALGMLTLLQFELRKRGLTMAA